MAKLSKGDTETLEQFDLVFEDVPEVDNSRVSKWDPVWEAATNLCRRHPGKSLRVRTYNNASTAYAQAKAINNGEFRGVTVNEELGENINSWLAQSVRTEQTYEDKNGKTQHVYAIYLEYRGADAEPITE